MSAHTPGPWRPSKGAEGDAERWSVVSGGAYAWLIATIENGQPGDTLATEAATARLIAAAPDLLAALKGATNVMEAMEELGGYRIEQLTVCRAAIAKAEGGQP